MSSDRQGNRLSGATTSAASDYDQALAEFNLYRGDPVATVDRALAAAPGFAMAHVLKAYLLGLAPSRRPRPRRPTLSRRRAASPWRRGRRRISRPSTGSWRATGQRPPRPCIGTTSSIPTTLLGLQAGHLMDFYRAASRDLRDRIARAMPHWSGSTPGRSIVLGMYAFGLEEMGDYARAEAVGREALDGEPFDCWAHHAVAHVMEMQGRAQDGVGWAMSREAHWAGDDNFFKVHNWWHRALCHLDLGQVDDVLRLYDGPIRGSRSTIALDLVDASALLWRLHLAGHDVGERWDEVARCWDQHADARLYPFNDWHATMAYLGAGRDADVDRAIGMLERSAAGSADTAAWIRDVGLPLIRGFRAFWRGNYRECAEGLHAARVIVNRFGGSHAQRDVVDWTLAEAALRGGMKTLAEALAHERLALKPHSAINRAFLRRARGTAAAT